MFSVLLCGLSFTEMCCPLAEEKSMKSDTYIYTIPVENA